MEAGPPNAEEGARLGCEVSPHATPAKSSRGRLAAEGAAVLGLGVWHQDLQRTCQLTERW